ncbi:MAG: ABC transporter permease [Lachnospiraceae bacterium]|nr:ABC transporter permease [Lachnospiraceae bacterium]MCR5129200.1 ABC transporter permease [Lachnospiraceae bacterium]
MRMYAGLTRRNILVYFKDKQSVIFSLLTSMIVFALYLLFLKGTFVNAINDVIGAIPLLKDRIDPKDLDMMTSMILLTGILGSAMITVPFNCLSTVVGDKENNVDQDILATPIRRWQIVLAYFSAAAISAILMTGIILTAGLVILSLTGNVHMSGAAIAKAYLVTAFGCISSTALFMIIVQFFRSASACGAFFGILSAVSGFVIGAYIPVSSFSDNVQTVCNLFPGSHVTILLRNALMGGILDHIDENIGGLDNGAFVNAIRDTFTFKARMFGSAMDSGRMVIYTAVLIAVSIGVMIVMYSKRYKK